VSFSAVVPAAGKAERFGGGKLLVEIAGAPMLQHTVASLLDAGASLVVVVAATPEALASVAIVNDTRVTIAVNPDPDRGMFSSIQIGLAATDGPTPVLVLPGDMPFVKRETVGHTATECVRTSRVIVPTHDGRRGHPVAIPRALVADLLAENAAGSLKDALHSVDAPLTIEVDDPGILRDVDTRADLDMALSFRPDNR
jgi:molybdenum cofactor cytidylyltransferase